MREQKQTASAIWARLDAKRTWLMKKCAYYSQLTIPSLMHDIYRQTSEAEDDPGDYQSLGAQAVNHLNNKMQLAMFAPSRPSFRLELGKKAKRQVGSGLTEAEATLAGIERDAIKQLDKSAVRHKLYQLGRHLIVTGNALLYLDKEICRVMGMKYYCVKRNIDGSLHTLVIREQIEADELPLNVQELIPAKDSESKVDFFKLIRQLPNKRYEITQWVNEQNLGDDFTTIVSADKLPYHALAWNLADEDDWGTGLVGEYGSDFAAASSLSEAIVIGGVLGTEFRWMVNPGGMTSVEDVKNSRNGDVLPGKVEDVAASQGGNAQAVQQALNIAQHFEQRVGRAFLLSSAVTRNAERVTAEEIRLTAQELETALGGVYSSLAVTLQKPIATWLLERAGYPLAGADIDMTIVTGLDALSRLGDLDRLAQALDVLSKLAALPQMLQGRVKMDFIMSDVGAGLGIDLKKYIMSDAEYGQQLKDQAQARVAEQSATANATNVAPPGNSNG